MSEKIKTAIMEIIKAHMEGEDKNTKAVLSDVMESVRETLEQEQCDECRNKRTSFCGNCNEYDEFEPCDDAISREAVLDLLATRVPNPYYENVFRAVDELPPVTQKSGKWIAVYQGDEIINYRCSECELGDTNGSTNLYGWDYCRRCGAKMESEE